jgi:hypothetical protein
MKPVSRATGTALHQLEPTASPNPLCGSGTARYQRSWRCGRAVGLDPASAAANKIGPHWPIKWALGRVGTSCGSSWRCRPAKRLPAGAPVSRAA